MDFLTYSFDSPRALDAMLQRLPQRYNMELVKSDMQSLVQALFYIISGTLDPIDADTLAWVESFYSNIATTVDIELI